LHLHACSSDALYIDGLSSTQGAHTSHLRTLSKISLRCRTFRSRGGEHFVQPSPLSYIPFRFRQHLRSIFFSSNPAANTRLPASPNPPFRCRLSEGARTILATAGNGKGFGESFFDRPTIGVHRPSATCRNGALTRPTGAAEAVGRCASILST